MTLKIPKTCVLVITSGFLWCIYTRTYDRVTEMKNTLLYVKRRNIHFSFVSINANFDLAYPMLRLTWLPIKLA